MAVSIPVHDYFRVRTDVVHDARAPQAASPGETPAWADVVRPGLLAAALSFPIWAMRPFDFVKFGEVKYEYVMTIVVLLAVLTLMEAIGSGGFHLRASVWLWALAGVVLVSLAASLASSDPVTAVNGTLSRRDGFLMVLANSVLFLSAYTLSQRRSGTWTLRTVTRCLVAAGVPVFAYALAQSSGHDPYVWEPFRGEGGRAFSTLGNPIFLGAYAASVALVAFGLWMESGPGGLGWGWATVAGMGAAVTVLTASRAAWFGLAVGVVGLAALAFRRGRGGRATVGWVCVAVVATLLVGGVLAVAPHDRATTVGDTAATLVEPGASRNSGRMAIWAISLRMIADRPLLGFGPDSMGAHFNEYRTEEYDRAEGLDRFADKPHSALLEWGVETGLPGAVLMSGLVAALLAAVGWALFRRRCTGDDIWVVAGLWAGALAYALQSTITVTAIGVDGMWWVLLGGLAGWLAAAGGPQRAAFGRTSGTSDPRVLAAAGAFSPADGSSTREVT